MQRCPPTSNCLNEAEEKPPTSRAHVHHAQHRYCPHDSLSLLDATSVATKIVYELVLCVFFLFACEHVCLQVSCFVFALKARARVNLGKRYLPVSIYE